MIKQRADNDLLKTWFIAGLSKIKLVDYGWYCDCGGIL